MFTDVSTIFVFCLVYLLRKTVFMFSFKPVDNISPVFILFPVVFAVISIVLLNSFFNTHSGCVSLSTRFVFIGECLSEIVKKILFQAENVSFTSEEIVFSLLRESLRSIRNDSALNLL